MRCSLHKSVLHRIRDRVDKLLLQARVVHDLGDSVSGGVQRALAAKVFVEPPGDQGVEHLFEFDEILNVLEAVGERSEAAVFVIDIEIEPVDFDREFFQSPARGGADDISSCLVGFE
jgi:hypothetical protein